MADFKKKEKKSKQIDSPTIKQTRTYLDDHRKRLRLFRNVRNVIYIVIVAAAVAVLIATQILPIFKIYGTSMTPTLIEDDLVVSVKTKNLEQGDLVAFYYNNRILVKRIIAGPGQWVDIDEDGYVYVDGEKLDEPYVNNRSIGQCDIDLPYQVEADKYFVMGDHRDVSIDSRSKSLGCIGEDQFIGKLLFRIWPLKRFGGIE